MGQTRTKANLIETEVQVKVEIEVEPKDKSERFYFGITFR